MFCDHNNLKNRCSRSDPSPPDLAFHFPPRTRLLTRNCRICAFSHPSHLIFAPISLHLLLPLQKTHTWPHISALWHNTSPALAGHPWTRFWRRWGLQLRPRPALPGRRDAGSRGARDNEATALQLAGNCAKKRDLLHGAGASECKRKANRAAGVYVTTKACYAE